MTTHSSLAASIPSCWTKRVQAARTTAPTARAKWQSMTLCLPLILCLRESSDILPVGKEVPLSQTILPDLLITVVLDSSGGGILRARPRQPTTPPPSQRHFGTVFMTLDELTTLCSGGELPFSMGPPSVEAKDSA